MNFKEALEFAKDYDSKLLATDPRLAHFVILQHQDGSRLELKRAFAAQEDEWVFVFSEHHRYFMYWHGDIVSVKQFKQVDLEKL